MANTIRLLGFAAVCGLFCNLAAAQESLLDVYQRAMQNDPAIREAEATYRATAEVKPQARSAILPTLDLNAAKSNQFSENPFGANLGDGSTVGTGSEIDADRNNWGIDLTQTVFNWARFITVKQADKRVAQAETDYEFAKQELLIRVAEVYFNVLAAEDTLAADVVTREATARQLEQAQRRFEVGLIAITDVQEFQAAYDLAVATEIEAERSLAAAQEFVREIIGESPMELAGPVDDLPLVTPDPPNPEQWVETALEQNIALVSSRIGADIAQDDIRIQRAARLPTLSFSAGYTEQDSEQAITLFFRDAQGNTISQDRFSPSAPDGYNWSLNFNMPLFAGGLNGSRIRQSVYQHRASLEALERVARQTERQTRDAYLGVISNISRVSALRQAVESSRTALRATEAGFEVGTRTSVDVLTSQDNLRRAETTFARSRYDYILNVLRLKQGAGNLSITDVEQVDGWLQ